MLRRVTPESASPQRLLYGLDRLPSSIAHDDPRLPGIALTPRPLRLNSIPLPPDAWPATASPGATDHAARMAAYGDWLATACGPYDRAARRFMAHYRDSVAAHVARHAAALEIRLAPFHGLYRVEDWCWSALRPLPRAWLADGRADIAFWDGTHAIPITLADLPAGDLIETILPPVFRCFWNTQKLPISPFRRAA